MKKILIGILLLAVAAFTISLTGFSHLGYLGKPVSDGSKETNQKLVEAAKANNSDQEAEAYFKRIATKSRVIERESKMLNIQVTDEEIKAYMDQTFATISETDKEVLAIASGFTNFEEYQNAKALMTALSIS